MTDYETCVIANLGTFNTVSYASVKCECLLNGEVIRVKRPRHVKVVNVICPRCGRHINKFVNSSKHIGEIEILKMR